VPVYILTCLAHLGQKPMTGLSVSSNGLPQCGQSIPISSAIAIILPLISV